MYLEYFGLKRAPYRITPDTDLFYAGGERGEILEALVFAITSGEAITKVVGEVGTGKTMLCRMLEQKLPESVEVVYLANPSLPPENVLHAIAFELGLAFSSEENRLTVMKGLQDYLLQRHAQGKQVVVFVEEAQCMPLATLEEIRLLSNLETKQHKLLQVVLFGQPELDVGLSKASVRQIKERITNSFYLAPLNRQELVDYLAFRLHLAGFRGTPVFSKTAGWLISYYSKGLMRRVNIIADKALLAAYATGQREVRLRHIISALKDCEFIRPTTLLRPVYLIFPMAVLLTAIGGWSQFDTQIEAIATQQDVIVKTTMPQVQIAEVSVAKPVVPHMTGPEMSAEQNLLDQRLLVTQNWLNQAKANHFTVQLLWAQEDELYSLERFLRQAHNEGMLDQVFVYRAGGIGGALSVVLGEYDSYALAKEALESIPEPLKKYQPYLRNVRGVFAEVRVELADVTANVGL